jgi:hypothetical protein
MKKLLLTVLSVFMVMSLTVSAGAKTFKMGLDADPGIPGSPGTVVRRHAPAVPLGV